MRCPHCGANISVRDEYCAWCGKVNEGAMPHISFLRRVRAQEEETRESITRQTLHSVPSLLRLLIIGLLLIAFGTLFYIQTNAWSWEYDREKQDAVVHVQEYMAEMDAYISAYDHLGFYTFMNAHRINTFATDNGVKPYERMIPYARINADYSQAVQVLLDLAGYRPEGSRSREDLYSSLALYLNNFYRDYEMYTSGDPAYPPLSGTMLLAVEDMKAQISAMMITRFGIDAEEAERIGQMTEAERLLLIEQNVEKASP